MWILCFTPVVFSVFSGICYAAPGRGVVTNAKVTPDNCIDEGVWILDGSIDCKYLHTKGVWGVDREAKQRCTSDSNTNCCQTCRKLGFRTRSSGQLPGKPEVSPPAPSTEINTQAPPRDNAPPSSKPKDQCRDEGIWIVDGLIDCKYLYIQGDWGVARQARRRCTSDASTNCCDTCRKLGFIAGSPDASPVSSTATTPLVSRQGPSSQSPSSTKSHIGGKLGPLDPTCVDNHVWIADMAVECRYLEVDSVYGLHSRPEYFCRNYSLTDCCWTCDKLGYGKGSNTNPPAQKMVATTAATVAATTPTSAPKQDPPCRDVGIWTKTGLLSCKYLERKSIYNVHENPLQACANPWTTRCCETCARIRGVKPNQLNGNLFGISRKVKLQGLSNTIV